MATSLKIPSPWQTELAVPAYVRAEGLQMRTFTTKWAPRGNYDDPDPYDPSWEKAWAQPGYVMAEGYGQGVFVTEWMPRGFYVGEIRRLCRRIKKHQRAVKDPIGNGTFGAYGRRVAAHVLTSVKALPPAARKDAIKKVMKTLDPMLNERTQRYAQQYVDAGFHPTHALELGMAKAVTAGLGSEVVSIGKKGRVPGGRCQTRAALGALGALTDIKAQISQTAVPVTQDPPQQGWCTADGTKIWKLRADGVSYAWFAKTASDVCTGVWGGNQTTAVHPGTAGTVTGGVPPELQLKMMQVGPFNIPLNANFGGITWGQQLPVAWQGFINQQLARGADTDATPGHPYGRLRDFLPNMPAKINKAFVTLEGADDYIYSSQGAYQSAFDFVPDGQQPIVMVKRDDNGEEWGVYLYIGRRDGTKKWDSTTNPYVLRLRWKAKPLSVWEWIKRIVGKVVDFVEDVVNTVGNLACQVLSSSAALAAGAGAAAAEGAPPQAGANGVAIVQQACAGQSTAPPDAGTDGSWILPAAIGGGILLAGILLTKKRK